ncbi:TSUP family transporter [bacterium]|nr:TSUP family transporter [bacterium]
MESITLGELFLSGGAAFVIALLATSGGVTGAFLLLPFQVSVLGIVSPAASATNHLYNVLAAPAAVARYKREGRLSGPLTVWIIAGTLPGVLLGTWVRIQWLPDEGRFKVFAGVVLLLLGLIVLLRTWLERRRADINAAGSVETVARNLRRIVYRFSGRDYRVSVPPLMLLSFLIGVAGGAYGVGGGVFTTAYLVGILNLPVYTTAGATLLSTWLTSIVGVAAFTTAQFAGWTQGEPSAPIWPLGLALGIGGLLGGMLGARLQKHLPSRLIRTVIALMMLAVAGKYLSGG